MKDKKNIILILLVIGVVAMTVAYASLSTRLNISGTAQIASTTWNIHFDNWAVDTSDTITVGTNTQRNTAVYPTVNELTKKLDPNITKVDGLDITLNQPNDYAKYTFEIVNSGSVNASLDNFEKNLTCSSGSDCSHIEYEIKCFESNTRTGNEVTSVGSLLASGERVYCYLEVKYKNENNQNQNQAGSVQTYNKNAVTASITANWQYVQEKMYFSYVTPDGTSTMEPESAIFYLKTNIATNQSEVCGVYSGGTVCLENAGNRYSEYGTSDGNGYIVTGYSAEKKAEMEAKGATCRVTNIAVYCDEDNLTCSLDNYGNVNCSSTPHGCSVGRYGSTNCY